LLALIGEQFQCANEITGVIINLKPNFDTISIWHRNANQETVDKIQEDIKKFLSLPNDIKMDYVVFYPDETKPAIVGKGEQSD
jgi:hypothetical protein